MTVSLATKQVDDEGRTVLRFERRLAHPPEKVWRAVTEPSELAHWFPAKIEEYELRPGAPIRFGEMDDDIEPTTGEVLEADPPKVFAFRWDQDVMRFVLSPDADGCRLVFTHALSGSELWGDEKFAAQHSSGWDTCLAMLAAHLAGESPDPDAIDDWFPRNEEYVEAFGLAEGEVVSDADGSVIRFERILIQPPDEAWAAMTGSAAPEIGAPPPESVTSPAVPAGRVTEVEPGRTLVYEWLDDGEPVGWVRWTVSGRKYACRLVLTQSVPPEVADRQASMLASWQVHLERFIARLHEVDRPWSDDRVELLQKTYAERF
jgi:uncharacterized protein YndB with AHSA1/START domain